MRYGFIRGLLEGWAQETSHAACHRGNALSAKRIPLRAASGIGGRSPQLVAMDLQQAVLLDARAQLGARESEQACGLRFVVAGAREGRSDHLALRGLQQSVGFGTSG